MSEQTTPKEATTHKPTHKHPLWEMPFRSIQREGNHLTGSSPKGELLVSPFGCQKRITTSNQPLTWVIGRLNLS